MAIVDEALARAAWPAAAAIGRRLRLEAWTTAGGRLSLAPFWAEVVGVVENVRSGSLASDDPPTAYIPFSLYAHSEVSLLVRASRLDGDALAARLRDAVGEVDSQLAVFNVQPLAGIVRGSLAPRRFALAVLAAFAASGLALQAVGLYGVLTLTVRARLRELAVRLALGATSRDVAAIVAGSGARLVASGVALGLLGAAATARLLGGQVYGTSLASPGLLFAVLAVTFGVAILACLLPLQRALKADPLAVLREE